MATTATENTNKNDPQWVFIQHGKHKGKTLRFVKRTDNRIGVETTPGKMIYLLPDHVSIIIEKNDPPTNNDNPPRAVLPVDSSSTNTATATSLIRNTPVSPEVPESTTRVKITGGKHKGKTLRFVKYTKQRVAVELNDGKVIYLLPSVVENLETEQDPLLQSEEEVKPLISNNTPTPRPVSPEVEPDIPENATSTWVKITGGKHKGKTLRFVKHTKERVAVELNDGKVIYLLPDYVKHLDTEQSSQTLGETASVESTSLLDDEGSCGFLAAVGTRGKEGDAHDKEDDSFFSAVGSMSDNLNASSPLYIQRGIHAGKKATFVKHTRTRIALKFEGESKIRYLSPTSLEPSISKFTEVDENDPMVQAIRHHLPSASRIQNVTDVALKRTLFGVIFEVDNPVFFDVHTESVSKLPHSFIELGQTFHLAAVKIHDKARSLACSYVPAPSQEHVANRLLHIGSFDKLIPRKTGARLELLLSSVAQENHIHQMDVSNFCYIPEKGNVGCGFIPRHMIDLLMGIPSPQVCALQVRIVIPSMGIFKGALFEKQEIDKIELPSSMQKVDAAINPDRNVAWLMINKTGIYPYPARVQQAENYFQDKRDIPEMAQWMLKQKGVSQTYLQQPNGQHSNLLGVADSTNAIPSGCVFLSGIHDQLDNFGDKVVISRFPMTEASDGRVLPIVREKPCTMSATQWDFLCSKPFGIVVFGNPAPGDRSMPEQIAQGDLDGDGYFVTWDRTIVQDAVIGDKAIFASKNPPSSLPADWWSASQEYMTTIEERKQSQKVIGRLHDCWLRNLRKGLQEDAVIFGRAFKNALVSVKHGGKISLSDRLCSQIPRDLHYFLLPIPAHVNSNAKCL